MRSSADISLGFEIVNDGNVEIPKAKWCSKPIH